MSERQAMGTCGAKNRRGNPCGHPAGYGTDHPGVGRCKFHLGSTRNHVAAAAPVMAARAVMEFGGRTDISPAEAVVDAMQRVARYAEYAAERMSGGPSPDDPWLERWQWAIHRQAEFGRLALQSDAEGKIADSQKVVAELLVELIGGVLGDLGVPFDAHAIDVVARRIETRG